jgi:hypothetical protein
VNGGHGTTPRICPTCGGFNPAIPRDELPPDRRYCTPLSCGEWTITHRLTKQGKKPLAPDGRAVHEVTT